MLARIESRELTEQYEFYKRHPYGDEWRMVARLCRLIAAGSLKKSGGGQFTEDEFLPIAPPKELRQQSDDEVSSILSAVLAPVKKEAKKKIKPKKK